MAQEKKNKKKVAYTGPSSQKVIALSGAVFVAGVLLFSRTFGESLWHILLSSSGVTYIFLSFYQKRILGSN